MDGLTFHSRMGRVIFGGASMGRVLIVDASAICRELLSKVLEGIGLEVACAATEAEALEAVGRAPPDLLLLEPHPTGQGFRVLEVLRHNPRCKDLPVIILTDAADKTSIVRAATLGVRDYMLKSRFSLAELLTRVQKYLRPGAAGPLSHSPEPPKPHTPPAAGKAQEQQRPPQPVVIKPTVKCLTREQTVARIEKGLQTKTLPGVVAEVMGLVNSPRGAISDLAQVVKRDPVLAARVLQLANSAAFASQKPRVATIDEAVRNIGVSGVRSLVLSVGMFESFAAEGQDALETLRCWQHSFAVASIMDRLVPPSDATPAGVAHLTGLCHDLAEIALRQQFPEEYAAAAELVARGGQSVHQARTAVFGIPFHELAVLVLTALGLPPVIMVPIEELLERGARRQAAGMGSLLSRALRIANVYAHGLMLAPAADAPVTPITTTEYRSACGQGTPLELDDHVLRSEALTAVNLLSSASSAVTARLCRPAVEPTGLRVWYARQPMYSSFDPLTAFLRLAADVDIHQAIPSSPQQLGGYDAIVVAAARAENPLAAQQEVGQILKLISSQPIPVLYLSGVGPEALPGRGQITCTKLPVSLSGLADFFARAAQGRKFEGKKATVAA